jgi:hypothetical protein
MVFGFFAEGKAMADTPLECVGLACPGLASTSPPAGSEGGLRNALRWLPDVPNADWPCLLLALCGGILVLLALWSLARIIGSARGPDPTGQNEGKDQCDRDDEQWWATRGQYP